MPEREAGISLSEMRLLETVFARASELPEGKRVGYALECFTEDDEQSRTLRDTLLAMLRADVHPPSYLDDASLGNGAHRVSTGQLPSAIGFDVHEVLGRGGMSVVYRAHQHSPSRDIALKVLRPAARSLGGDARLRREAQALARLSHPGIAQVYHVGVLEPPDDRAFVAMELVDGRPINDAARDRPLRERVALLASVAEAVGHAHVRGVVHRDLKPANVLVDGMGRPKVLDFGVARLLDDPGNSTALTHEGDLVGTLGWMAPEQRRGPTPIVDQRADVYALGALAYEVLAGRPAFALAGMDMAAQLRTLEQVQATPLGAISPDLRGDLASIVRQAMERDPDRRYNSAGEFAADLRRYLAHQPVVARRPTTAYMLGKLVKRHRVPLAAATLVLAALIGAVVTSTSYAAGEARAASAAARSAKTAEEAREAEAARADELERISAFQSQLLGSLDPSAMGMVLRAGVVDGIPAEQLETVGPAIDQVDFTQVASDLLSSQVLGVTRRSIDAGFGDQPLLRARLLQSLCDSAFKLGLYALALEIQREAFELRLDKLGSGHELTVASQSSLGSLLAITGAVGEAEETLTSAIEVAKTSLGEDHPTTLDARHRLGYTLHNALRFDDAEPIYRDVAERQARVLGEFDERRLRLLSDLAALLRARGTPKAAEPLSLDVLERRMETLGEAHPDTLVSMNNHGILLMELDRPAEAEPFLRRALELKIQTLGRNHPSTATSLNSIGYLLYRRGDRDAALPYVSEALAARREIYGNAHPRTLLLMDNLAIVYRELGRMDAAMALANECIALSGRVFGLDHRSTLRATLTKALIERDIGDLVSARALIEDLMRRARATGGQATRDLSWYQHELGVILYMQGQYERSAAALSEAYEERLDKHGASHANTRRTAGALGDLYDAWHATDPRAGHDERAARYRALADEANRMSMQGSGI